MKRIYLLSTALVLGSVAFGQKKMNAPLLDAYEVPNKNTEKLSKTKMYNFSKAPGSVLFSEDFNGGMGGFTVNAGTMDTIWKFDTDGPDGQYSSTTNADIITSTTASNGFMIYDADLSNPGSSTTFQTRVGALTSPAIDMTGINSAIISYENTYRTCCSGSFFLKVQVSTDDFATSTTYNVHHIDYGVNLAPPTFVQKVNVADFLATATNKSNFKFRFFFDGNESASTTLTSHYYWQVDDVKVYENWSDDNSFVDHSMAAGTFGIPYYNMTVNQISPIVFSGIIRNDGVNASAGTTLTTTISNGGTGTVASTPITIAAGAQDTVVTASWTPTATGPVEYYFNHTISATATDENPSDNVRLDSMNITNFTYSVDNAVSRGSFVGVGSQALGLPISCGNIMEVINDDWVTGISISLNSTATNVGQIIKGEIWKYDSALDDYFPFAETEEITITAANNNTTISPTMLGGPVKVFAGDDLLVMQTNYGNGTANVSVRTAQRVPTGVVAGVVGGSVFSLTDPRALMVRLLLDPTASVDEVAKNVTIANLYPNPTEGTSTLKFNTLVEQNVAVQVVDITGKVMFNTELGNINAGGHSVEINTNEYKAGIYFVNLMSNDGIVTKKLIKK
jgi:hypothetical protein